MTVTEHGAFFTVTGAGTFKGMALSAGDRLIYAGRARESNVYDRLHWTKLDAARGEVALMGETATPASVPPAGSQNGDLWYVTASDGAYGAGDDLLRRDGAWMRLPAPEVTTVVSGASLWLPCANVAEYEMRRADKGTTRVAARLSAMVERRAPATRSRDIWVVGDSMLGFLDPKFAAALPDRDVTVDSWGGAISYEVLSQVERSILDLGDPYKDRVWIGWHGQNNVGYYDQTNEVNDRLARLSGARGGRVVLMSVLGQWTASYSGGRIMVSNHENQFNDTSGQLRLVRNHLRDNHAGSFFDTRAELCATAGDTPALLHPGMTEKEVADTYGIVPFSFFFDLTAVPWDASDLVFRGYRSAAGLPTGGADNDYYIRSAVDGSDPVGQLLIREGGTWVTRQITDITHMRPDAGNVALAGRIANFLKNKDW